MRAICLVLTGCLLLVSAASGQADKDKKTKIDKAKLVGTWTFVKTDSEKAPPPETVIKVEFTKDGKITLTQTVKDKTATVKGTYSVAGDQLTTLLKYDGEKDVKEVMTIKELTDKKFVTTEKKDGKLETTEFKK